MKSRLHSFMALFVSCTMILSACNLVSGDSPTQDAPPPATEGLGEVIPTIVSVPSAGDAARAYLDAWGNFDYPRMYSLLTKLSSDSILFEDFEARYADIADTAALSGVDYEILQTLTNPSTAQVGYRVKLQSILVGEVIRDTTMNLTLEGGVWRIVYADTLILPDVANGNWLSMKRNNPTRGIIYDRDGEALAADSEARAIQVVPSLVEDEFRKGLLTQLSILLETKPGSIENALFSEDAPFLVPVGVVSEDRFDQQAPFLEGYFNTMRIEPFFTRLYFAGNGGANAIGYTGQVSEEEIQALIDQGKPKDAVIGRLGLESWGEEYLSGKPGGELYVVDPEGNLVTLLAQRDAQPAQAVHTTLDLALQREAQRAIRDFSGAIVVLERDTGRILAMVSSPTFDPNSADLGNPMSDWGTYFPDDVGRFFNRATQGQYPPGSIFKLITLAAALESERWTSQSRYLCEHTWDVLGIPLDDWTLSHSVPASGELNLLQGLMRSCNPWFYNIGYTLYEKGDENLLAEMARGFGIGKPTGIEELAEASGNISDPNDAGGGSTPVFNAVQQAIGQSDTLLTPLQAAVYVAAVGNGGNLLKPQLIESVEDINGDTINQFESEVTGTLPVSEENLDFIKTAMRMVTSDPRGTAYRVFGSANVVIPVYGKTGTAENVTGNTDPHAWFIGFTDAGRKDKPDIAIAVLVENVGDGSEFAAPIFRRVLEVYWYGSPQRIYYWEDEVGLLNPYYFLSDAEREALENEGENN